ncbi:Uncharacterized protein BN1183_AY_00500 [Pantoea ananatis]|nr:Uncharacterized protein BN1183_AY_00500 [Pantoea ananatis]
MSPCLFLSFPVFSCLFLPFAGPSLPITPEVSAHYSVCCGC